jgi:DNA-binding IclR family transcriptional regulator
VHARRPLRVEDIAQQAELPKSTAYRLVRELVAAGLLASEDGGTYWLGIKLLQYGGAVSERISVREVALPVLRRLADETGETVHLTVVDGLDGVYVEKVDSPMYQLRWHIEIGQRVPLYAGAAMKVLLAFLDRDAIESVIAAMELRPLGPATVTDPDQLRRDLEDIRSRGWAMTSEEINAGATGVSAPVFDSRNRMVAGMTITGASSRLTDEMVERFIELVCAGAAEVSSALGARRPAEVVHGTGGRA